MGSQTNAAIPVQIQANNKEVIARLQMHVICLSPCLSFFLVLLCNTSCTSSQRAASIFFNLLDRIRGFWSVSCISPALVAVPSFPGSVTHWGVSTCIKVYSVQECFCSRARHCACLSLYMSGEPKFSFYFVVCPVPVTSHGVFFFSPSMIWKLQLPKASCRAACFTYVLSGMACLPSCVLGVWL